MTTVQVGVAQDRRALFQCPNCKVLNGLKAHFYELGYSSNGTADRRPSEEPSMGYVVYKCATCPYKSLAMTSPRLTDNGFSQDGQYSGPEAVVALMPRGEQSLMSHVMRALAFADALTDSSQASYDCGDARILARLQGNDLVLTIPLALIKRDIQ